MTIPAARQPTPAKRQRPQKGRGPIPARQQNGFYADHTTGERLRSVTTIINGGVPKESLIFWAANTCTDSAIENLPALVNASRDPGKLAEMRDWVTRAHTRKKEERGDIGSAVHRIIEAHILQEPIPQAIIVGDGDQARTVALDGPELGPYVEQFHRFVAHWQVEFTASEMVVANYTDHYAGTLDYTIADGPIGRALRDAGYDVPPGVDIMGDTKTGGTVGRVLSWSGHVHGVYPEAGLQMSAYRRGEKCWLRDGSKVDMPPTAGVGIVLHLGAEGYNLYPARCGDDVFPYFQHARIVDEFTSKVSSAKAKDPIIGRALTPPATTKKGAA